MRIDPVYLVARESDRESAGAGAVTRRGALATGIAGLAFGYLAGFSVHRLTAPAQAQSAVRPDAENAQDWARLLAVGSLDRLVEHAAGLITVANGMESGVHDLVVAAGIERLAGATPTIVDPERRASVAQSILALDGRGWFGELSLDAATIDGLHRSLRVEGDVPPLTPPASQRDE